MTTEYDAFAAEYSTQFLAADAHSRSLFTKHLPQLHGKRVLDIGCGNGHDVATYTQYGAIASGIDPSEQLLEHGKKQWHHISSYHSKRRVIRIKDKIQQKTCSRDEPTDNRF